MFNYTIVIFFIFFTKSRLWPCTRSSPSFDRISGWHFDISSRSRFCHFLSQSFDLQVSIHFHITFTIVNTVKLGYNEQLGTELICLL